MLPYEHVYTHTKLELDVVIWDLEAIIRIKSWKSAVTKCRGPEEGGETEREERGEEGKGGKEMQKIHKFDDAGE